MRNSLKYTLWPIVVILLGLILSPDTVFAAQPVVQSVTYHDDTNILDFVFDQPVYNSLTKINQSYITFDGDDGGKNPDLTLSLAQLVSTGEFVSTVRFKIAFAGQSFLENMVDRTSLKLVMHDYAFLNQSLEGSQAVTLADNFMLNYEVDQNPPTAIAATYDAATNILKVTFSEIVDSRTTDLIKMSLDDDAGGPNKDLQFNVDNVYVVTQLDNIVIEFGFTPKHQQKLEAMELATLSLNMLEYAIRDKDRNTNKILLGAEGLPVSVVEEPAEAKTKIDSASYDASVNRLSIYLNEAPVSSFKWRGATVEGIIYGGISIHDLGGAVPVVATLSGKRSVSVKGNMLQIEVLPSDQRLLETLENPNSLKLTVEAFSILDKNLNGIQAYTLDDAISISYYPITMDATPSVDAAKYDAALNRLTFTLGNIARIRSDIDTSNVILTGIKLVLPNQTYPLTGGAVSGIKTGTPAFIREVFIDVTQQDESFIESNAAKGFTVAVDEQVFFFQKTLNGNLAIENLPLTYIADANYPSIIRLKYDFQQNQLQVDLDRMIQTSKFSPNALNISGVQLSGGAVLQTIATSEISILVNKADSVALNSLDIGKKKDLEIVLNAGALLNLDNVANPQISFKNADLTALGDTIVVGYGRGFWTISFETFPTPDELVPASLRGVGDHSYIYVADAQWGSRITAPDVQQYLDWFEKSTPTDASKGIYQLCREAYGNEKDTDNDPKVILFFTDLKDQYGVGLNARSATWPKSGYFTQQNELSTTTYAHSNEADMLYVDAYPIVAAELVGNVLADQFTRMLLRNVDEDEEAWIVEGIAAMSQILCGFQYQSFEVDGKQIATTSLKGSAENVLTLWTGWQAGVTSDWYDLNNTFLFHLYLYEQYGSFEIIKEIARDSRNQGVASVDSALARLAAKGTISRTSMKEVFPKYALACFLDNQVAIDYVGEYALNSVNLGFADLRLLDWKKDNYWRNAFNWTYLFFKVKKENIPDVIRINGTDGALLRLEAATMSTNPVKKSATLDPKTNIGALDLTDMKDVDIVLSICNMTPGAIAAANFVLSKDNTPPAYIKLNLFQNPSADKVLDAYLISQEKVFRDVPSYDPETATVGEGVNIRFTLGTKSTDFFADRSFTSSNSSMFLYHSEVTLSESGTYAVSVQGQDMAGNAFSISPTNFAVRKVLADAGAILEAADQQASLTILAGSLAEDQTLITVIDATEAEQTIYRFGAESVKLIHPATLTLQFSDEINGSEIAVFHRVNNNWKALGGTVDLRTREISVQVDQLGDFKIAKGQPDALKDESELPATFALSQNYPNPFNPVTTIQYALPQDGLVTLSIFNVLGEEVARLIDKPQKAGYHQAVWDAQGVGSGVYFYKIVSGDFSMIRKMTLLK
jgi:hypothetical protein